MTVVEKTPHRASAPATERGLGVARGIARFLDDAYIDPLLGLVLPGIGDVFSSAAGFYVIGLAIKARLPAVVIARMLLNLTVDTVVGAIPIGGDIFDAFHKSHRRNLALLEARYEDRRASARDWIYLVAALLAAVAALALPIYVAIRVVRWLF